MDDAAVVVTPAQAAVVATLAAAIPTPVQRPVVVGITGVDGAGKTELARRLHHHLVRAGRPCALIHLDDFHHPRAWRRQLPQRAESYIRHAFDLETLVGGVLAPLRQHGSLDCTLALLDLASDTRSLRRRYTVTRDMVVLLEGVLLFRPPVDEYLDLRVLVHIDPAQMPARLQARDGGTQAEVEASFREKLLPVRDWFWRTHRPDLRADLVIDNRDVDAPHVVRGVRLPGGG